MKVLVISHEYPPIGGGGGKVVQDLCSGLASHGYQIHLLTAMWGNLPKKEEAGNLVIERLPSGRMQSFRADFRAMASFVWKSFWRGLKVIREWQPDLIHAHFAVPSGASAFSLSVFTHTPYVITAHGGDVPGGAPEKTSGWFRYVLPLSKPVWKRASKVAAVSNQTRQLALKHYKVDIQVIPNGIDPASYHPGKFSNIKAPTIIYIGRFSPEKNALAVPQVMVQLTRLDWQCIMLGDGPQMDEVKALVTENHLEHRFTLPGWVEPSEVTAWMKKSDILLMPSLREAMPMTGLQALAMGLAIVASDIGSVPDLVKNGENGFLVKPGNLNGYAEVLKKLLDNKSLLENCRLRSREMVTQFDMRRVIAAYEALYQQALKGKGV
ncbi:MAG: glycosyltransferase family 4 protein [Anaerolineaceae bacterium]|nr:glycosyltransferase family 4 protein [Anaerolineaceae bacterium]